MRTLILLPLLLLCALTIQPTNYQVNEAVGEEFTYVLTIANDEDRPIIVQLEIDEYSTYLEEYIDIEQKIFSLPAQTTKNLQIKGKVPPFGPENHNFIMKINEDDKLLGQHTLKIPIAGVENRQSALKVTTEDLVEGESLVVNVQLSNYGNVNEYYNLEMNIQGQNQLTQKYPKAIQVLPGEQKEVDLVVAQKLEKGEYTLELITTTENQELQSTSQFTVIKIDTITLTLGEEMFFPTDSPDTASIRISDQHRVIYENILTPLNGHIRIDDFELSPGNYVITIDDQTTRLVVEEGPTKLPIIALAIVAALILLLGGYYLAKHQQ